MTAIASLGAGLGTLPSVDAAVGFDERRRRALHEVLIEVGRTPGPEGEPALALRSYDRGCVALALAGTFDHRGVERLRAVTGDLDRLATVELVIELSQLTHCDRSLARVLGGLRVRRLVAGVRVELHHPPSELTVELGHTPAEAFVVVDEPGRGGR